MASGNFVSLYGAIKADGKLLSYQEFLTDINPVNIRFVLPITINDVYGDPTVAFWIKYQNSRQVTASDYYLPTSTDLPDLDAFLAALVALNVSNTFTKYTDLVKTSMYPNGFIPANYDLILPDLGVQRTYLPKVDQTKVVVNIENSLLPINFYFDGDQTYAGAYTYFGS